MSLPQDRDFRPTEHSAETPVFRLDDLDYDLPAELIAQKPAQSRDQSRLLVVDRRTGTLSGRRFDELPSLLRPGDVLVLNDSKVLPARFFARRTTGGRVEGLFVRDVALGLWEVMLKGGRRLRAGETLSAEAADRSGVAADSPTMQAAPATVRFEIIDRISPTLWRVRPDPPAPAVDVLARIGVTPLPPYIRPADAPRGAGSPETVGLGVAPEYQTVYAERPGSVAAPTAGLHFTERALGDCRAAGAAIARVTLHIGPGTFAPIQADDLSAHRMHPEWYEVIPDAAALINDRRAAGGRIVAVGTTSVRILETCADDTGAVRPAVGWTDAFIYPPHRFRAVDAMLTNFHLPRSTLLALVMAFAGPDLTRTAYGHAIAGRYRFYSFGDAMFAV